MNKIKLYNDFFLIFIFVIFLQILLKFSLYNCTFYDFGIIFKRQNFLEEKNYKDFFGGHIRIYEIFLNFLYNKVNHLFFYFFLISIQIFIYLLTFFYLRRKNKILSLIFLVNPIATNALFFDFHFEYLAVFFSTVFFYNSNKKYSIFLILPIIFISELYAFFSLFLIWLYFRNYKVNFIGLVFCVVIFLYVYFAIFYLFDWAVGGVYEKYNLNYQIEILYITSSIIFVIFFSNKKFYSYFIKINNNNLIILINIIIFIFFLFFFIHFKNINFINLNNHYFLIISFLSSIVIYNFFIKNNYYKFIFLFFFLIFNPTIFGMQFYFNEGSVFYYKNYINFSNLESQKNISQFISSIDKNKNILINNHLCNINVFNHNNIFISEDELHLKKIDYIIFTSHNYAEEQKNKFENVLNNYKIEYFNKNNNYIIGKIK